MLEIAQVNQFYGGSHTLWDAALEVPAGGCVCLMGRNGVGKTTLLKVIMGLLPSRSGSIRFAGQELAGTRPERRARLGIGYVPQGREIFADLTVEENLKVGLAAKRARTLPDRIFTLFPVLKKMLGRDVITRLNGEGIAVLLVEQKLPFARRVARTFCMMDRGRTVATGAIADLSDDLVRQHLVV